MNNKQLKNRIDAIVENQIKIATYCMGESLFPDSFQTEIKNCFLQVINQTKKLIDDFEPELEFEAVEKWLSNYALDYKEERELLQLIDDDEIEEYYENHIKKDNNEIVITCDSMLQREKIREFLETEIFTDCLRYNAAVENL